jgi:pimeloyl-ACP methyl ester carboxylesterase
MDVRPCSSTSIAAIGFPVQAVAGHSMGGGLALMLAGTLVDLVPRYLILDNLGLMPEAPEEQPERMQSVLESIPSREEAFGIFPTIEAAAARVQANNPGLSVSGAERMVRHAVQRMEDGRYEFRFDRRSARSDSRRYPEATWLSLFARVRAQVRCTFAPSTLRAPGRDHDQRLAAFKDVTMTTAAGVGHHVHLDAPEIVADELRRLFTPRSG